MTSRIILLYPKINYNIKISNHIFPFSYDYLINCYYRLKNRKNHETLDGEKNPTFYLILFMFLKFYSNFDVSNIQNCDVKQQLLFTDEKERNEFWQSDYDKLTNMNGLLDSIFKYSFKNNEGK